jgi:hypothetical protein
MTALADTGDAGDTADARDTGVARGAWLRWAAARGLPADEAAQVGDRFLPEMTRYCELISGPAGECAGLMTRGEDDSFTARAAALMRAWSLPAAAVAGFLEQAALFQHKRAFLKLEWGRRPDGGVERLAAYYHRRRPQVPDMQERYLRAGVDAAAVARIGEFARLLGKGSIHFVAAALRPGQPTHHKLYFSQYVTPETGAAVARRLRSVMDLVGIDPASAAAPLEQHPRLLPPSAACTVFVSMKFTDQGLLPGLKIDYPQVTLDRLALCAPAGQRAAVLDASRALCAAAGVSALSFLGVRLAPGQPAQLKLYADLPSATPAAWLLS